MNDLQKCQLDILKEFIRVCEKHNLRYFLNGGTCIGSIRHGGFIPWDDDVDVSMPRPDYEKFLKLQSELKEGYFIQCYKTDKKYCYNFAKIRNSNTTYIENFFNRSKINHGVWIDIFPLDGVSKKMVDPNKFKYRIYWLWLNTGLCYPYTITRKIRLKTWYKDIFVNLFSMLGYFLNVGHWMNKLNDKIMNKVPYDEATMVGNLISTCPNRACMDKNIFGKGIKKKFEDIEAVVPEDYDKYLSNIFGDYMKLPPIDKQVGHHHNKGFSLTQGYKEYMEENKL